MAGNLIQNGDTISGVTPSGGYASGELVVVEDVVGISADTYAEGETFTLIVRGVFSVAKVPDAANGFTQGDSVYVDGGGLITNVAAGSTTVGIAWEATATGSSAVPVSINWGGGS